MDPILVDGEMVEITSRRTARVKSKSKPDVWYAVDLDARGGKGECTCRGFEIRKDCRHLKAVLRFGHDEAETVLGEHTIQTTTRELVDGSLKETHHLYRSVGDDPREWSGLSDNDHDWRVLSIVFLPDQMDEFESLVEALPETHGMIGVAARDAYEGFVEALGSLRGRSIGTTVSALTQIAQQRIACFQDDPEGWVKIESLFNGDAVPAATGRVVMQAVSKLITTGRIKGSNPWQALELWAAETLAGP